VGDSGKDHRLISSASASVNGNSLAAMLIGHLVGPVYGGNSCVLGQIDGFADSSVAVFLKSGLHLDMPGGGDVISTFEDAADFGGYLSNALDAAGLCDSAMEFLRVEALLFGNGFEDGVYLQHLFA